MKIAHSILFYVILFLSTVFFGSMSVASYYVTRRNDWAHRCGRLWGKVNLWAAGVSVYVKGADIVKANQPCILAANHQSWFDIFALFADIPIQFRWLAKEELFRVPILGPAMYANGAIPVDRGDRRKAFQSIDKAAIKVKGGTSILIFPEGTRSPDGVLQEFKSGGFILAVKSQQPIIPISISGSHRVLPKSGTWLISPGNIRMTIGKPVMTQGLSTKDRDFVMNQVRNAIQEHLLTSEGGKL